jgi:hypothetical protein
MLWYNAVVSIPPITCVLQMCNKKNITVQVPMALYYRNLECSSSKVRISFQCRGFRVVSFILNGKISNTAKEIVHMVRIEVYVNPEEEGSKMVENVILLHFFHSVIVRRIYCECGLP